MHAWNQGTSSHISQAFVSSAACTTALASSPAYGPAPGHGTTPPPPPAPIPTHTPTPPLLGPVQVPPGHCSIELVQFWRDEYRRGQPLHWALFVRTAPRAPSPRPSTDMHGRGPAQTRSRRLTTITLTPRGNFYELVGTPDTYTAQFLPNVTFEPDALVDWRGTHVIGWVNPGQLSTFETIVREVPVWRHKPGWRSQQWVYEVVRAVGGSHQGMFTDVATFGGLQRHMGRLLDAWENGDI